MAHVVQSLHQAALMRGSREAIATNMNDGDTEDDDELSEASDDSQDSSERRKLAAMIIKEDMSKLERIFREKGMKYRLIDRIGEGIHILPVAKGKLKWG